MESVESKVRSLCDDSQIVPENSVSLAENVEGFQLCLKEILKLIQQDRNSSELTINDHKRSELVTQVTELLRLHTALADQHNHVINSPPPINKQHLDFTDSSSPQVTQMFTPDQMSNAHKFRTPIGFDLLQSPGNNGSNTSRRDVLESSFSLSSDSDSESFISTNKLLISPVYDGASKSKENKVPDYLLKKISNLEEELVTLNSKLQSLTDENTKLKHEIHEQEKTQSFHLEAEKSKVIDLQNQVVDLTNSISNSNYKIETLEGELEASRKKLSAADDEILKLNNELSRKIFEQTQWLQGQLGSTQQEIAMLQTHLDSEKNKVLALQEEVSLSTIDISTRDEQITELNTKIHAAISEISELKNSHKEKENNWNTDITRLKTEVREKCDLVNDLNRNMDAMKHKHDNLMTERDGINAQLNTIRAEICSLENLNRELEKRLKSLQDENLGVIASSDSAEKEANELRLKLDELEKVMLDRAEEKREAIRQLSFSLEHYMSGYKELRQAFVGNKRRAVLTS